MRRVIHSMGMPISIDIPDCNDEHIFTLINNRLSEIDDRYSTYKQGSMVSRFQRGELSTSDITDEFTTVMNECARYEALTDGYFSAKYRNVYDPTGYVKGWAIHEIGLLLRKHALTTYLINAAGDIEAASSGKKEWRVGLQDPFNPASIMRTITLKNGAVATSGTYERGQHIYDPHTHQPATDIISASVWGPDIITADVFATAAIAMGAHGAIAFMRQHAEYQLLLVPANTSKQIAR